MALTDADRIYLAEVEALEARALEAERRLADVAQAAALAARFRELNAHDEFLAAEIYAPVAGTMSPEAFRRDKPFLFRGNNP